MGNIFKVRLIQFCLRASQPLELIDFSVERALIALRRLVSPVTILNDRWQQIDTVSDTLSSTTRAQFLHQSELISCAHKQPYNRLLREIQNSPFYFSVLSNPFPNVLPDLFPSDHGPPRVWWFPRLEPEGTLILWVGWWREPAILGPHPFLFPFFPGA